MSTDADGEFFLEGPHCTHDECSWCVCDLTEGDPETDGVLFFCKEVRRCGLCGPTSKAWSTLVRLQIEWMADWAGTAELPKLRELGVAANVIEIAELIEQHPVK